MKLLHGMGGNRRLWDGLVALVTEPGGAGPGSARSGGAGQGANYDIIAPDLAGHGQAPHLPAYGFDAHAHSILERVGGELAGEPLWIIGHSLGGAVGITLASMDSQDTGLDVRGVVSVGMKTAWSARDVSLLHRVADKGVLWFDTCHQAAERYVTLNGLSGILAPDAAGALAGVTSVDDRWRFSGDPEAFRLSPTPIARYVAAMRSPLLLASGVDDAMSPPSSLEHLGGPVTALRGVGHNAHV